MKAVERRAWKKALDCYEALEEMDGNEGDWSRKAGEMYRRLDRPKEAAAALRRAISTYVREGSLLKAIAVCRLVLAADPHHAETRKKLDTLWFCQRARVSPLVTLSRARQEYAPAAIESFRDGGELERNGGRELNSRRGSRRGSRTQGSC